MLRAILSSSGEKIRMFGIDSSGFPELCVANFGEWGGICASNGERYVFLHERSLWMPGHAGEIRILIVEDEKVVAETLGQILRAHGYDIQVTYSAEEAIEVISHWPANLAILDVMLPKMNGIDLAIILKQEHPDCHVLLFSGQPSVEGLMQKARNEGHQFDILAKPVHPTVMLHAISTIFNPGESACSQPV